MAVTWASSLADAVALGMTDDGNGSCSYDPSEREW